MVYFCYSIKYNKMFTFIKSIIFIILSIAVAFLTNQIIGWVSHWYVNLSWLWLLLIFFFVGGLLTAFISFIPKLLSALIVGLRSFSAIESMIVTIALVIYTFISCSLIWRLVPPSYPIRETIAAISLNIMTLGLYLTLFRTLVQYKRV